MPITFSAFNVYLWSQPAVVKTNTHRITVASTGTWLSFLALVSIYTGTTLKGESQNKHKNLCGRKRTGSSMTSRARCNFITVQTLNIKTWWQELSDRKRVLTGLPGIPISPFTPEGPYWPYTWIMRQNTTSAHWRTFYENKFHCLTVDPWLDVNCNHF